MNILFNTLCIFLQVGFRACPLAFQSFVEDGFFIWNIHWPEQKCPDTQCPTAALQLQAHSAGSHRDPYVSLPGASSIGPLMTDSLQTVKKSGQVLQSTAKCKVD